MRSACLLLVATAPLSLASRLASQPSSQHGKTATRGCVAPAAPLLLRLRGGVVRTLAEGEWEALHEEAGDKLVVVDFTAVWCGPCQRIAPTFEALAEEFSDTAVLVKVDVDELGGLAAELGISSMPTFLFYKGGDIIHTMRGADEAKLREKVAELVQA
jgi:thioredoxin